MNHLSRNLLTAGSWLSLALGCHPHNRTQAVPPAVPVETGVCSLVGNPANFVGETVVVNAEVATDTRHFVLLVDTQCRGQAVVLRFPEESAETPDLAVLREVLFGPKKDQGTVRARFIGTFQWRPNEVPSRVLLYQSHDHLERLAPTRQAPLM